MVFLTDSVLFYTCENPKCKKLHGTFGLGRKHQERTVKKDEFKFLLKETGRVLALLMAGHTKGVDRQ